MRRVVVHRHAVADRGHQSSSFWASSAEFSHKAALLVFYVGLVALSKGITDIILAFKLKGVRKQLATS